MQYSRQSRRSSTQPTAGGNPRPSPKPQRTVNSEFALLLSRSIFIKGPQHVDDPGWRGAPAATRPAVEVVPPERSLVFNGLTESGATTALIEDTANHKVNKLHVGDPIASGKLTRIDFDSLDYTTNAGKTIKVAIGQNFEGATATPTSGPAAMGSGGGGSTAGGGGGGSDSVLERMRQRRMQGK
jgi:hypothetical protein